MRVISPNFLPGKIVDFLYRGEVNVFQENLDSFLAVAEELQLKGLIGKMDEQVEDFNVDDKSPPSKLTNTKIPQTSFKSSQIHKSEENGTLAIASNFCGGLDELDERVRSLMVKSQNKVASGIKLADLCKVCGKEGEGKNIKDHIEANHLEGIVIPCNLCETTFKTRKTWKRHMRRHTMD